MPALSPVVWDRACVVVSRVKSAANVGWDKCQESAKMAISPSQRGDMRQGGIEPENQVLPCAQIRGLLVLSG